MNYRYVCMRMLRRIMPRVPRWMLYELSKRNIMFEPSAETFFPSDAVNRYEEILARVDRHLRDATVLVFGYGGYFGTAVELIKRGARHVFLYDKYNMPDHYRNRQWVAGSNGYLYEKAGQIMPNADYMTVIDRKENCFFENRTVPAVDMVLSSSVMEHVRNVEETIRDLRTVTTSSGIQVHCIDLRDHYFKYPFEMLCYSQKVWNRFLNPGSNVNRLRARDFERIAKKYFGRVVCEILDSDNDAFTAVRHRIKPEFLSGNSAYDSATLIALVASDPIQHDHSEEP